MPFSVTNKILWPNPCFPLHFLLSFLCSNTSTVSEIQWVMQFTNTLWALTKYVVNGCRASVHVQFPLPGMLPAPGKLLFILQNLLPGLSVSFLYWFLDNYWLNCTSCVPHSSCHCIYLIDYNSLFRGLPHPLDYSVNICWIKWKEEAERQDSKSLLKVLCRGVRNRAKASVLSKVKKKTKCLSSVKYFHILCWVFWDNRILELERGKCSEKNIDLRIRTLGVPALGRSLNISWPQLPNLQNKAFGQDVHWLINRYLWSTYHVSGTVLGTGDACGKHGPVFMELTY